MQILPILKAMMRNKVGAILIGLQIAITLAIITNAMFIIQQRSAMMHLPSGVDEENTFYLRMSGISDDYNIEDELNADLALIRNMPGIVDATTVNSIPLSTSGSSRSYSKEAKEHPDEEVRTASYRVDEHFLAAFGAELIEGETFIESDVNYINPDEPQTFTNVLVTEAFAKDMFGKETTSFIGKKIYDGAQREFNIKGVIKTLQVPWAGSQWVKGWSENSVITPVKYKSNHQSFMVRTEVGKLQQMIPQVETELLKRNAKRIIRSSKPFTEVRYDNYRDFIAMNAILKTTIAVLFIITSLGIVGLASFTVNRRKKQIGTRRALGARRIDIIQYFMTENWLISSMGLVIGVVMTYLLNYWLVENYSMTRIEWFYAPVGMATIFVLGQLAVIMPATKAASISPALATRSV